MGFFWKKKHTDSGEEKREQREGRKKRERKKTGSTHEDLRKKERGGRERQNTLKIEKKERKSREDWLSCLTIHTQFKNEKQETFEKETIIFEERRYDL